MTQSPPADIVLKPDTTRVVGTLDLVTAAVSMSDQSIRVAPDESRMTLYRRTEEQSPSVSIETSEGTEVATFDHTDAETTRLRLTEDPGSLSVDLANERGTGTLGVYEGDTTRTRLTSTRDEQNLGGGLVSVHDADGTARVVARTDTVGQELSAGLLEVSNADGNVTGRLVGADGLLELTGARDGAGEVVLVGGDQQEATDVFVHITGSESSESVVSPTNGPRIRVDGRNARLELGRGEQGPTRDGVAGRANFLAEVGGAAEPLLSMHTAQTGTDRFGRLTFYRDDGGTQARSGVIDASDGLVFNGALRVDQQGGVHANQPFAQRISPGGPILWTEGAVGAVGETVRIELTLGDSGSFRVELRQGSSYELVTPLEATTPSSGEPDARVWLQFDTASAGTSSRTLTVDGDATVKDDHSDYSESGSVSSGRFEVIVEGANGLAETQIELE